MIALDILTLGGLVGVPAILAAALLGRWAGRRAAQRSLEDELAFLDRRVRELPALARGQGWQPGAPPNETPRPIARLARELEYAAADIESALDDRARAQAELLVALRRFDRWVTAAKLHSTISHELASPLNVIVGRATILLRNEELPEAPREQAQSIADQGKRLGQTMHAAGTWIGERGSGDTARVAGDELLADLIAPLRAWAAQQKVVVTVEDRLESGAVIEREVVVGLGTILLELAIDAAARSPEAAPVNLRVASEVLSEPPDPRVRPGTFLHIEIVHPALPEEAGEGDRLRSDPFEGDGDPSTAASPRELALGLVELGARRCGGFLQRRREDAAVHENLYLPDRGAK